MVNAGSSSQDTASSPPQARRPENSALLTAGASSPLTLDWFRLPLSHNPLFLGQAGLFHSASGCLLSF